MFWVYVLQNPAGRFYIGQGKMSKHNRPDIFLGRSAPLLMLKQLSPPIIFPYIR